MDQIWVPFQMGTQTCCIARVEKIHSAAKEYVFNSLMMGQIQLIGERWFFNMRFQSCPALKSGFASDCELRTT
jgi:hypothetical protein